MHGIGQINANPVHGREVNSTFVDIVKWIHLEKQVSECTKGNHILDLVFASQCNTINKIGMIPGMSYHDALRFEIQKVIIYK